MCSTFNELLIKDGSVFVHNRNIHAVAIEMYKAKHGLSPELLKYIFYRENLPRSCTKVMFILYTAKNEHSSSWS